MKARLIVAAATLFLAGAANAQPLRGVAFAGGTISDGHSGYAGLVHALPGAQLGQGLAVRGSANAGKYRYDTNGQTIEGRFVGAEIALVYQLSGQWGWASFSAGPRLTDISLSPDDVSNDRVDSRLDLGLQTDGAVRLDPAWRLDWIGSVGVRDGSYYSRVGLGRLIATDSGTRLGLEAGLQGDPAYRRINAGMFAATKLSPDLEGQISVGMSDQEHREAEPYLAVGISHLF